MHGDVSLWIMKSLLPTSHNLYWHKERLFMLERILYTSSTNVWKLMERKIFTCARRTVGGLFFPNLIRLLCEEEDVEIFKNEPE